MKRCISIVLALIMAFSLCACGGSSEKNDTPAAEASRVLHLVPANVTTNLDIMSNTSDEASLVVSGSVFEQLVSADADYKPVPELCTGWDVNDDSTEYVYHLREGVKFHNGETINTLHKFTDEEIKNFESEAKKLFDQLATSSRADLAERAKNALIAVYEDPNILLFL